MSEERSSDGPVLKTLLVSDLVDTPLWVERLGDRRAAELFARHDRMARDLLAANAGREIDKSDGFLLLFDRPVSAVAYSLAYHAMVAALGEEAELDLASRVGIHLGEVILRHNPPDDVSRGAKPLEVEGLAKPIAARLMGLASPHQTLLTQGAFDLARRSAVDHSAVSDSVRWLAHGSYRLKGIEEAIPVFEVGAHGSAPLAPPPGSPKALRLHGGDAILGWRPAAGLGVPPRPNWRLERKLGEGGFGEVWLARHTKTGDRRVMKFCFRQERLTALQREITVFRLLKEELGDRDDIARILDWSFDEAPYFIESEYTVGGSLLEWTEARGGLAAVPMATRLEIIAQAADALAAAHSVGVLHKDVKPANLLIEDLDDGPQARLTDFGIGLVTEPARLAAAGITAVGLTRTEAKVDSYPSSGTPLYLAPELMEGRAATVQADVYALGVMLYQMAAGDLGRALGSGWERHVDDELLREEIASAVDVSPRRRLRDASVLAQRLRSLEQRRIERAESRRQAEAMRQTEAALGRARRRRRIALAVATLAVAFGATMAFQAQRIAREATRANREAQVAERISTFLIELFELSDPDETRGRTVTARELLARGAERIRGGLADEPVVQARLLRVIGNVHRSLGLYEEAEPFLIDALARQRELHDGDHLAVATSRMDLGLLYSNQGRFEEAEPLLREAAASRERALGSDHLATALARQNLANLNWQLGRYDEAVTLYQQAAAVQEELEGPQSADLMMSLHGLGMVYSQLGRYDDAEPLMQRALAIGEEALGTDHPRLLSLVNSLAILYADQRRYELAGPLFRRTLELHEKVLGPDHPTTGMSAGNLAILLRNQGRYDEAEPLLLRSLAIHREALGPDHLRVGMLLDSLAILYGLQGRDGDAERSFRQSLALLEAAVGPSHIYVASTLQDYADFHRRRRRYEEAEPLYARAVEQLEALVEPGHPSLTKALEGYAETLRALGREDDADAVPPAPGAPTDGGAAAHEP